MSAIQWVVFLAYLATPSQPKEVLYSTENYDSYYNDYNTNDAQPNSYYNDYNTNDAFVTRKGESSLDTEELSRYAGTTAQERSGRQTIGELRQEIQYMQLVNKREMRQLRQEVSSIKSQLAAQNQMGHHHQQKQKIQDECSNYHSLSSPIRAISNSNSNTRRVWSDNSGYHGTPPGLDGTISEKMSDWGGHARYRFTRPFTRMAVQGEVNHLSSSAQLSCGTRHPAYIADPKAHDMEIGEMKEFVKVCYVRPGNICAFSTVITITRCPGDYFVYRLPEATAGAIYCGHK